MKQLTAKQQDFYDSLVSFFQKHLRLPSHREAAELNGFKSANSSVQYHRALVKKGYLKKDGPDNYTFSSPSDVWPGDSQDNTTIPILGEITAGAMQEAIESDLGELTFQHLFPNAENIYALRKELRSCMDQYVGVYRTREGLESALQRVIELKQRFQNIHIQDKNMSYNTNLIHTLELENLLDLAHIMVHSALTRTESRGGHARRDYPKRDDEKWHKHTLAHFSAQGPRLDYKPVVMTTWKPVERKY